MLLGNIQYIKNMKKNYTFSKTLIIKILCVNDIFIDAFNELKDIGFGDLRFDYIDIEHILESNLLQQYKQMLIECLLTNNKIEITDCLIQILNKYSINYRCKCINTHHSNERWDLINSLKYMSFTNSKFKLNTKYKSHKINGNSIIYSSDLKIFVYNEFVGGFLDLLSYISNHKFDKKSIFKVYKFGLMCII